ncbi:MAG TPA: methylmalonyl-CoA epimerase [Planctomycetota bacterium]|nr:methylmalonyl-CoA epimerase [Planctomycetota bacterium]
MEPLPRAIDHVAIAVPDLEAAIAEYTKTLGVRVAHRERIEEQGVSEALLEVGGSYVQLLQPLGPDTPVGKFLAKRGSGIHHVAYRVPDVAAAIAALKARGARLVDETPRRGSRGTKIAFVHPASMGGVLVELVESPTAPAKHGG